MITASDGRTLTPPKELKPLLKGAYPAFFKLLGHIRFFYTVDERWDAKASLGFERLADIALGDGAFAVHVADESFHVTGETQLDAIYTALQKSAAPAQRRSEDQLAVDLAEYPSGIRCDLCQLNQSNNTNDVSGCEKFQVMNRHCYYGVEEGWGVSDGKVDSKWICEGKRGCYSKTLACLKKKKRKGVTNCLECGEFRTCDRCGVGHNPGECNLGITAEEVTCLIIPYCEVERLELMHNAEL